jgi:hypothetical protein
MSNTADNVNIGGTINATGGATLGGSLVLNGDISAGGGFKHMIGDWRQADCTASQAAVVLPLVGGDADITGIPMPAAGSIVGVTMVCEAARTAGSCSVAPTINGTAATGLAALLNSNASSAVATKAKDSTGCTFAAGQIIGVKVTTTSDWAAATTPSIAAFVWVEC